MLKNKTILITGSAGFIGFHVAKKLLENNNKIIGIDNFNNYYDPKLKLDRNKILKKYKNYVFYKGDICDLKFVKKVFQKHKIDKICHLAAQAGVRYSLTNPHAYIQANLVGFTNIIDEAKNHKVKDFIYASSSSVYGTNKKTPFAVDDSVDQPASLYAATKKANELIAYTYYHLYQLNCTGLRFFTVYGPYGRPDMALFSFTQNILANKTIEIFNYGKMERDFTYIDDIVAGIVAALEKAFPYEIFNLGNHKPAKLNYFVELIEKNLGQKAKKNLKPMQAGDVPKTFADIKHTKEQLNWQAQTTLEEGIAKFILWYKEYYKK